MGHQNNITRIKAIHNALGQLGQEVVYVGGATISLYLHDIGPVIRNTEDVDVVVEIWNYADFHLLDEKLRHIGFKNDQDSGLICRYSYEGIIVDILPTEGKVLSFSNK